MAVRQIVDAPAGVCSLSLSLSVCVCVCVCAIMCVLERLLMRVRMGVSFSVLDMMHIFKYCMRCVCD